MSHIIALTQDQAIKSVVSWSVGFLMGAVVVRGLRNLLRKIADLLDTNTPSGLGDVMDELKKQREG